jgi:hypothetical protein
MWAALLRGCLISTSLAYSRSYLLFSVHVFHSVLLTTNW